MSAKKTHAYDSLDPATASRLMLFAYPSESAQLDKTFFALDRRRHGWGPGTEVEIISRTVYGTNGIRDEKSFKNAEKFRKKYLKPGETAGEYRMSAHFTTGDKVSGTLRRLNNDSCKTHGGYMKDKVDELYDALPQDEQGFIPVLVEKYEEFESAEPKEESEDHSQVSDARYRVNQYVRSWGDATWATHKGPLMINREQEKVGEGMVTKLITRCRSPASGSSSGAQ